MIIRLDISEVRKMQRQLELYKDRLGTASFQDAISVLKRWKQDATLSLSEEARELLETLLKQHQPRRRTTSGLLFG